MLYLGNNGHHFKNDTLTLPKTRLTKSSVCVCVGGVWVWVCVWVGVDGCEAGNVFLDIFLQKRHADSKY